jgi:hypothetical protein
MEQVALIEDGPLPVTLVDGPPIEERNNLALVIRVSQLDSADFLSAKVRQELLRALLQHRPHVGGIFAQVNRHCAPLGGVNAEVADAA